MRLPGSVGLKSLEELAPDRWDAELGASQRPFRFSHRAALGIAFQAAFASHRQLLARCEFDDGTCLLAPLVRVQRRLGALSLALGMPLGLEGVPIVLAGEPTGDHLAVIFGGLEPCGRLELFGGAGGSPPAAGTVTRGYTHTLDLTPGYESLWDSTFPAKTRNMVRKAERSGVTVAREDSPAAIEAYWELYRASALGWGYRAPPYPRALFSGLLESEHAHLWLARVEEDVAAGAVLLEGSHDLLYWSGAMNRDFRHVAPSNAIIRAVIEEACQRGLSYLDFGSSTGLSGVEAFKRSFGAQLSPYTSVSLSNWRHRQLERVIRLRGLVL